jgi:predicted RNA binding protein YcfA (HicA-like mRNA interferase family)
MAAPETKTKRIIARLERDGWIGIGGKRHDVFKHPSKPGRVVVARHREQTTGVARRIAKQAGWSDR